MREEQFDLVVIGSGTAGSIAAERARAYGKKVAIIEKDKLGGDCANYACVPSKALLRSAQVYSMVKQAAEFGVRATAIDFDWSRVMARKEEIVNRTGAMDSARRFREQSIAVFTGEARFEDEKRVRVDGSVLRGDKIMIATGSKPEMPRIQGIEQIHPITSIEALSLASLPSSLIIVGGGPVGCELAQLFSTFGVRVTMLVKNSRILEREEPELAQVVCANLQRNGVKIYTNTKVAQFLPAGVEKRAQARTGDEMREFRAQQILVATGREPQTATLNLQAAGVETEKGRVKIDDYLQTSQSHIYAGGDVAGPMLYTHFAFYQGSLAAKNVFSGMRSKADYRVVPRVTFTAPEIASVGMTEEQARQKSDHVCSATFEIRSIGKALVDSEETGMIKIVADEVSGEILGGHIVAPGAGELIHEIAVAMVTHANVSQLADSIHAYPTFAEGIKFAAGEFSKFAAFPLTNRG